MNSPSDTVPRTPVGPHIRTVTAIVLAVVCWSSSVYGQRRDHLGDFFGELFAPINHTHFSSGGAPFVHPFNFEPPQIHQDVFFIYKYTENTIDGENEHEAEAHIDWALTRRIGFVFAVPLIGLEDAGGTQSAGIGDLEIAPRLMLIETERFISALNLFITAPTGDATRDLGAGETVISPYFTTWHDLGNWSSLLVNVGPNIGTVSGEKSISYAFSLNRAWQGPVLLEGDHASHHHAGEGHSQHFPPGMTVAYLELTGETELDGDRRTFVEIMPGLSYVLTEHAEVRFGVLLPVSTTRQFDARYFLSFTWIH